MKIEKLKPMLKNIPYYFFQTFNFFWGSFFLIIIPLELMDDDVHWGAEAYYGSAYESKEIFVELMLELCLIFSGPGILAWFLSKRKRWLGYLVAAIPFIIYVYAYVMNYLWPQEINL